MEFDTQSLRSLALAVWVLLQGPPTPAVHPPLRAPAPVPPLCVPRPPPHPSACPRPVPSGQKSEVRPGSSAPRRGCRSRPAGGAAYPAARQRLPGGEGRAMRSLDGTRRGAPGILGPGPPLSPQPLLKCPLAPAACSVELRPLSRRELDVRAADSAPLLLPVSGIYRPRV